MATYDQVFADPKLPLKAASAAAFLLYSYLQLLQTNLCSRKIDTPV